MNLIKSETYQSIISLVGRKIHFISDCELFENFDIIGRIISISISKNDEYLFKVLIDNTNKEIIVGSNMKNLQYELVI